MLRIMRKNWTNEQNLKRVEIDLFKMSFRIGI